MGGVCSTNMTEEPCMKNLLEQPEEKREGLKDLLLDKRIILKRVLGIEWEAVEWIDFLQIWATVGFC
jgi:hypothetical protein